MTFRLRPEAEETGVTKMAFSSYMRYFVSWILIRIFLFNIVLGGSGIFLIIYELCADRLQLRTTGLGQIATFLGTLVTFIGVAVTAASIYFPIGEATKPDRGSYPIAAIVIIGCVVAIYILLTQGRVPENIVNGFALLGLSGALMRIQPNPQLAAERL
ncbi:MAG: hypothetical protein HYS06_04660 [Methylocystis sp.]|nr:hypothetical protein [Methylocystis sp.]MBI3275980.1 hypothetical protein [Methylocystis sp.]